MRQEFSISPDIAEGGRITVNVTEHGVVAALAYLAATALPLMLSTQRTVVALGGTYTLCREAFVSDWCFFAIAGSVVMVLNFERLHESRPAVVAIKQLIAIARRLLVGEG